MFIERAEMKRQAKMSLKGRWGLAIGAMILYYLIDAVITVIAQYPFADTIAMYQYYSANNISYTPDMGVIGGYYLMTLLAMIVVSPIMIGWLNIALRISKGEPAYIKGLFSYIPNFFKTAGLFLLIYVKTLLWSLLFIVPGIIASLNYSQAYYIMADNPDIGIVEAIERSKQMMKGNKWRFFVMQLSFLGWMLLTAFTLGILGLWSIPYMQTSYANFYNALCLEQAPPLNTDDTIRDDGEFGI